MANIDNEASNTRKMRKHHYEKLLRQPSFVQCEETDLMMCSSIINTTTTEALNANKNHASLLDIMRANPQNRALVSDVDPTLLLKIFFKDPVTLTSAGFRAEASGLPKTLATDGDDTTCLHEQDTPQHVQDVTMFSGPKEIQCFSNADDLDFSDADFPVPAQRIILSPEQLNGQRIALKGSRFSRCLSVQFFINQNQHNTPCTFLNRLCLWGRIFPAYCES